MVAAVTLGGKFSFKHKIYAVNMIIWGLKLIVTIDVI